MAKCCLSSYMHVIASKSKCKPRSNAVVSAKVRQYASDKATGFKSRHLIKPIEVGIRVTGDWPEIASVTLSDSSDASVQRCRSYRLQDRQSAT